MRKRYVIGNWKMNGSLAFCRTLLPQVTGFLKNKNQKEVIVAVCPPFTLLAEAKQQIEGTPVALGAQDLSPVPRGARTGEISAEMLLEMNCRYVLVGHSERRHLLGETDNFVAEKCLAAQKAGLIPIVCVGETQSERASGETEKVVRRQLDAVLSHGVEVFEQALIAYEPVWAIGTGVMATPEQAASVHAFIRAILAEKDQMVADTCCLLYGGSVKAHQVRPLLATGEIDGVLVGGASLEASEFNNIIEYVA